MMYVYIYLLIGAIMVLKFYPFTGKKYETIVAFLVILVWPVVFYHAGKAWQAYLKTKKSAGQGGDKDPSSGDRGQEGEDKGQGGGA